MPTPPSYKVHQKISAATGGSPMKAANHSNKDSSKQNSSLVQGKDIDMSIPRKHDLIFCYETMIS